MSEMVQTGHIVVGPQFFQKVLEGLYASREVFLRELLANCQTGLRKREMLEPSFAAGQEVAPDGRIEIRASRSGPERWIEISDNGSGISKEEFETVLPRVGETGTQFFRDTYSKNESLSEADRRRLREMVGFFGVGLYSGFLVAKSIRVTSRRVGESETYQWTGYRDARWELAKVEPREVGTTVRLVDVERPRGEERDPADESFLEELVRRWADYCPYPVRIAGRTVNRRLTPWQDSNRPSQTVLLDFYRQRYPDRNPPLLTIPLNMMGGKAQVQGVLYVLDRESTEPATLLIQRVPVDESIQVLPEWASFVWGVVDSPNLPMRLDREGPKPRSAELEDLKKTLPGALLRRLAELPEAQPETWRVIWEKHGERLLQAAVGEESLCQRLGRAMMFPSTKRTLTTIRDYIVRAGGEQQDEMTVWFATDQNRQAGYLKPFEMQDQEVLFVPGRLGEYLVRQLEAIELEEKPTLRFRRVDEEVPVGGSRSDEAVRSDESRVLRDMLEQILGPKAAEISIAEFEPAEQPAQLSRMDLPAEWRRFAVYLEDLVRAADEYGSLENLERLPAPIRQLCEGFRAGGADVNELVRHYRQRRLVVNWRNPAVRRLADMAAQVEAGRRSEQFRTLAELLWSAAGLAGGETLSRTASIEAHQACCKSLDLMTELLKGSH